MIKPKQNNRLGILLSSAVIGATLCSSTAALARALEEHEWARPLLVPIHVRQELVTAQYVDECPTTCSNVGVSMEQQYVRMTPIHWQAREQQEDSTDQPEPSPPSDLPPPPDPEPHANVPGPTVPPSDVPTPTQPGLPPPMPEPSAPHLAPPPPPMPEPAEPPPLSHRPDLNPATPGAPKQHPTPPSPQLEPEPTVFRTH